MASDTNVEHLVVNKMTQAQYDSATKSPNELYLTPEQPASTTVLGPVKIDGSSIRINNSGSIYTQASVNLPDDANGWHGYYDANGKKHRWKTFTGTTSSMSFHSSVIAVDFSSKMPTDLGTIKTNYILDKFSYGCDWGECFMKLAYPLTSITCFNGYNSTRTSKYWCYVDFREI